MDWIFSRIASYGGDTGAISIIGHSAGAHISSMSILRNAFPSFQVERSRKPSETDEVAIKQVHPPLPVKISAPRRPWPVHRVKYCFGISGPYDLVRPSILLFWSSNARGTRLLGFPKARVFQISLIGIVRGEIRT